MIKEAPEPTGNDGNTIIDKSVLEAPEEELKPGALYAGCAVVKFNMPALPLPEHDTTQGVKARRIRKTCSIFFDEELGGEAIGRAVWEACEADTVKWPENSF